MVSVRYDNLQAMVKAGYAPRTVQDAFNLGGPQPVTRRGDVARIGGEVFKVHPVSGTEQQQFMDVFKPTPTPESIAQDVNRLEAGKFDKPTRSHDGFLNALLGAVGYNVFSGNWGEK